mmetsp:Transcript_69454/g.192197  ORF Transcript_69454/g.192197 Transcript_69454/m.192197 type:complete len:413 (-) Transcript_69454:216-1454(-)
MRPSTQSQVIRFRSLDDLDELKYWLSFLKVFVLLLGPSVVGRFLTGDFWGGVNASAGPIVGIFLLKDEDWCFAQLYAKISRIWLVEECCGVQRGTNFTYTLSIFLLISFVNGLLDLYEIAASGFDVQTPSGTALSCCASCEVASFAVSIRIQKALRSPHLGGARAAAAQHHGRRSRHLTGASRASGSSGRNVTRSEQVDPSTLDEPPVSYGLSSGGRRRRSAPPAAYAAYGIAGASSVGPDIGRGSDTGHSRGGDTGHSRGGDTGRARGGDMGATRGSGTGCARGSDTGSPSRQLAKSLSTVGVQQQVRSWFRAPSREGLGTSSADVDDVGTRQRISRRAMPSGYESTSDEDADAARPPSSARGRLRAWWMTKQRSRSLSVPKGAKETRGERRRRRRRSRQREAREEWMEPP